MRNTRGGGTLRLASVACGLLIPVLAAAQVPPFVTDDEYSTEYETPVTTTPLNNDAGAWVAGSFTQPANGAVDSPASGQLRYSPAAGFSGVDSFTYTVVDSSGPELTATVTVTVEGPAGPSAADDFATTSALTQVSVDIFANDSGDWVSGTIDPAQNGQAWSGGPGIVNYFPYAGFTGVEEMSYTLVDSSGIEVSATVYITVEPGEPFGEVQDDFAATSAGVSVDVELLANDTGGWVGGSYSAAANGTVTPIAYGLVSYTPDAGFIGQDSFTYSVIDIYGPELTATVTIDVLPELSAEDDFTATNTDVPVLIDVAGNDGGTVDSRSFTQPVNGLVADAGDELEYTPNANYKGIDSFDYTLTDAAGNSSTATVTIAVNDVVFVDVTAEAGIAYTQFVSTPIIGPVPFMSGGAAAGDYNGDGAVDLYVTRLDDTDILYANNGNGSFTDVTAASGISRGAGSNGAVWGDIDNDGDLDLYVTAVADTRFYLYINNGPAGFSEEAVARGAALEGPDLHYGYSATFGDYDKDGFLDLHVSEWRRTQENPTGAISNSRLLRNLGTTDPGVFEDVTVAAGVALDSVVGTKDGTFSFASRFADLDNDGWPDLAIAADFGESRLFWNDGEGGFIDGTLSANVGTDENGMGNAIADVNGDGLLDWFVSSIFDPLDTCAEEPGCAWGATGNRLYVNNGGRSFTDATTASGVRDGYWGWGSTFIDYDNDGDQDLVHTNGVRFPGAVFEDLRFNDDPLRLFVNDGTGIFGESSAEVGLFDTGSGKGLLKFDYDLDGDLDLFVVNANESPILYRNDGGNMLDWMRVEFATSEQAVGARVVVTTEAGGASQTHEVNTGSNFLGQDELAAHFGVGSGTAPIHSVLVSFPSGETREFADVPRNSVLQVTD